MSDTLCTDIETRRPKLGARVLKTLRCTLRSARNEMRFPGSRRRLFPAVKAEKPARVVVAGAGLAGLATAFELEKAGHKVTLLEANSQVGGRASTIREPFTAGLHIDTGGFRFAAGHFRIRHYLREFGLTTAPFFPVKGDALLYYDGSLIRRRLGEPIDPAWLARPMSDSEKWMLDQEVHEQMFRIRGGVDRLAVAFNSRLAEKPRLGCELKGIEQTPSGVRATALVDGDEETLEADFAVCAMTNATMRRLDISPAMVPDKQRTHDEVEYRQGLLVFFEVPTEYWLDQKLSGFALTDTVGEVWTPVLDEAKPMSLTLSYTKNEHARELLALPHGDRARVIVGRMEEFLPYFGSFVKKQIVLSWNEEQYIGGTASTALWMNEEQKSILRQPHGRIHFVGEHMARGYNMGWMEGALESAHRVTREITEAWSG